jgi:hypothetical protein
MKFEVKEHSEPDVRQYPYIGKHPKGFLVFFNIGGGGSILNETEYYPIGYHTIYWSEVEFELVGEGGPVCSY